MNLKVHVLVLPFMLLLSVLVPTQANAATDSIVLGDFHIQDAANTGIVSPTINSDLFLSFRLNNNDSVSHSYVVVFDIRDSKNYSVALRLEKGEIPKYASMYVHSEWTPDVVGTYTVRAFVISSDDSPEVLSPVISKSFEVLATKPAPPAAEPPKAVELQHSIVQNATKAPPLDDLRQYALKLINQDRAKFGVSPVKLSDNRAAQVHADDVFKNKQISHWMSNGEKPYMTYSRLGGTGDVSQNVSYEGYDQSAITRCEAGTSICEPINPKEAIARAEDGMMNNDAKCCQNGHRDNIIDKYHTEVSIGIAYDDYYFVIVQNFENNYLSPPNPNSSSPIFEFKDKSLTINARIIDGEVKEREIDSDGYYIYYTAPITIYYDPPSTSTEYLKHKDDTSYSIGVQVACLVQFADNVQCQHSKTINANSWSYFDTPDYDDMLIRASLSDILKDKGVYTVVIWAEPVNASGNNVPTWQAASYSIVWDG